MIHRATTVKLEYNNSSQHDCGLNAGLFHQAESIPFLLFTTFNFWIKSQTAASVIQLKSHLTE